MSKCIFGEFTLTCDGRAFSGRGAWTIKPSTFTRTSASNQDGSMYQTQENKPATAEGSISACDSGWEELIEKCDATVTLTLTGTGTTYTFVNANVDGDAELDTNTGEVSGIMISAPEVIITRRQVQ